MPLFTKAKSVLWVKAKSVDVYFDREDDNVFNLDINLLTLRTTEELAPLANFIKQHHLIECPILIGDDIIITKSFIYDSVISEIDKKEVIGLAESSVPLKIDPEYIEYELIPIPEKTIIRATIYDKTKMDALKANLSALSLVPTVFKSVSSSISHIISGFYTNRYFLIYPLSKNEYTLFLADKNKVYLTATLKGPSLDVQKIINYATLYFAEPINKIFTPGNIELELNATSELDKTPYNEAQIAKEAKKAGNIPLPILGLFSGIIDTRINNSIPKTKSMENKKNYLPLIAVFIITAAIASIAVWYFINRNKSADVNEALVEDTTSAIEEPTATPTIAITEVKKDIKIQVLNATKINGQAATLKEMLTKLGFTSVAVGNAKDEVDKNEIQLKTKNASDSAYFKAKLPEFPAEFTELSDSSTYDAVFVIGTDLKTGTSSPAPTKITTPAATTSSTVTPTAKPSATPTESE